MKRKFKWPINTKEMLGFHKWWTFMIEMLFTAKLTKHVRKWWEDLQQSFPDGYKATEESELDLHVLTCRDFHNSQRLISKVIQFLHSKREGEESNSVYARVITWAIKKGAVECICVLKWVQREKQKVLHQIAIIWLRWQSIRPFSGWQSRGGGESKGRWQWCTLTLIHFSWGQSTRPKCKSPAMCRTVQFT